MSTRARSASPPGLTCGVRPSCRHRSRRPGRQPVKTSRRRRAIRESRPLSPGGAPGSQRTFELQSQQSARTRLRVEKSPPVRSLAGTGAPSGPTHVYSPPNDRSTISSTDAPAAAQVLGLGRAVLEVPEEAPRSAPSPARAPGGGRGTGGSGLQRGHGPQRGDHRPEVLLGAREPRPGGRDQVPPEDPPLLAMDERDVLRTVARRGEHLVATAGLDHRVREGAQPGDGSGRPQMNSRGRGEGLGIGEQAQVTLGGQHPALPTARAEAPPEWSSWQCVRASVRARPGHRPRRARSGSDASRRRTGSRRPDSRRSTAPPPPGRLRGRCA